MKNKFLFIVCFMSLMGVAQAENEAPSLINTKRLSLGTALMIAQAAVNECTKKGIQIGVTVVDREGLVQVILRDSIAAQITVPISKGKAFTAANFNEATSKLLDRANTAIGHAQGMLMESGGLPIRVGGSLVGAIGVSGAPLGETDEQCAKAGIEAVIDELEMSF